MKKNKQDILFRFKKSCMIIYQSTLSGDYKSSNKEAKKLIKIFMFFEENREFALECLADMIKCDNVVARTKAAAYYLALNENLDLAQKVLIEISGNEENGIFGFNAKMTLDVWKKQGYLSIYQK